MQGTLRDRMDLAEHCPRICACISPDEKNWSTAAGGPCRTASLFSEQLSDKIHGFPQPRPSFTMVAPMYCFALLLAALVRASLALPVRPLPLAYA